MGDRWDLNEEDLWEEEPPGGAAEFSRSEHQHLDDLLLGQDQEEVLAVYVTDVGEVRSARLADDWKSRVDPRSLGRCVVQAVNAATIAAATAQAEVAGPPSRESPCGGASASADESPITAADALQLVERATADIEAFQRQVLSPENTSVSTESSGGHVGGNAQRGHVLEITVDPRWSSAARNSEIESELVEVLKALRSRSFPAGLVNGPRSQSLSQLHALISDPQRLLRRLGLKP